MKKNKIFVLLLLTMFSFNSCETVDLDGVQNPNSLPIESKVDENYLLNSIQVDFSSFYNSISSDSRGVVRMVNQFGSYASAADPQNTQSQWSVAYADILNDVKKLKSLGADGSMPYHLAIGKIIESYTLVTLVDFYGDVPYSETLLGASNMNPNVDSGADVYDAMLTNLDEAIALLSGVTPINVPKTDFYYGTSTMSFNGTTSVSKWIKVANSLKLKMYNNLRLTRDVVAPVNAIIASGNYMTSNADDFNFKYSTTISPTNSRHPDYNNNYDNAPDFYLSNSYYKLLFSDKTVVDPRRRYYFYRQTGSAPSTANLPCSGNANIPICYVGSGTWGAGYWGRDHADNTGLPADATRRTVVGLYPAGGRFDANNYANASTSTAANNAKGAGILNILDYSFVQFMLAELALTETGVTGSPLTYLDNGVASNITKVMSFRIDLQNTTYIPTTATVNSYKSEVSARYTAATGDEMLNTIIKEFFIASWGNGLEAYNMYRRTGMPLHNAANIGIQSPVTPNADFVRSFFYPSNSMNNNSSMIQHTLAHQVFWDNNPANFID